MSKISQFYLMREEKALDEMQEIQREIASAQDTYQPENDRWYKAEDTDKEYQSHCSKLMKEEPF